MAIPNLIKVAVVTEAHIPSRPLSLAPLFPPAAFWEFQSQRGAVGAAWG